MRAVLSQYSVNRLINMGAELACFVDKHGIPSRKCGFVRWETKADSFAHRGRHVLLFSTSFIEIREVNTARLVQVLEGTNIRLLQPSVLLPGAGDGVFVAMRGEASGNERGDGEKIVELLQTSEIATPGPPPVDVQEELWREWDMA